MDREQPRQKNREIINFFWVMVIGLFVLNLAWIIINPIHMALTGSILIDPWVANGLSVFAAIVIAALKVFWLPSIKNKQGKLFQAHSITGRQTSNKT